jgi:hypothetical protein
MDDCWFWNPTLQTEESSIDSKIWQLVPCDFAKTTTAHKFFDTRQLAEIALAEGLHKCGVVIEIQPAPVEAG